MRKLIVRTYDVFASFWPRVGPEAGNPIADLFNSVPQHVATHRPVGRR